MENKVRDFVYLDTKGYISLESIKVLYWATLILPFMMFVMGIAGKSLFPILSVATYSLIYWTFVAVIQSKHVKKTFALRFLVNGMTGLFISSLFAILLISIGIVSDILEVKFAISIVFFYMIYISAYTILLVIGVHKGVYAKIKEKSQSRRWLKTSAFTVAIIPCMGVGGMYLSKILRATVSVSVQTNVGMFLLIVIIFLPGLSHINFVQYYYCKKYRIICDEDGDTTSPNLERKLKKSKSRLKNGSRKLPLMFKILVGIVCVTVAIFLILLIIGIIINL